MKKVLILVLSSDFPPYSQMIQTSKETWNSVQVDGCETFFYCSAWDTSQQKMDRSILYFDVPNTLFDMGRKDLAMYRWAIRNRSFDYVARVNASCYVDKKKLVEFIQDLPEKNLFMGVEADSQNGFKYLWGGCQTIISHDVLCKMVENEEMWNHKLMEDESSSLLVSQLGIPFTSGIKSCSIDKEGIGWQCISYCGQSASFLNFGILKDLGHIFYRVKCDGNRTQDEYLMKELFKNLNND